MGAMVRLEQNGWMTIADLARAGGDETPIDGHATAWNRKAW